MDAPSANADFCTKTETITYMMKIDSRLRTVGKSRACVVEDTSTIDPGQEPENQRPYAQCQTFSRCLGSP
jgi:hypothetical protein